MMKTRMAFVLGCVLIGASFASAQLMIDFSQTGGAVESGYSAYVADHESAATFTSQDFTAFGTTITITPSWVSGAAAATMQMIDRGGDDGEDTPDLLRDWIGTDGRQTGNPMTLTISGLPAGNFSWLSYHHDTQDQTGVFDVTVNDAAGSVTTTDIDISSGDGDGITALAEVTTFSTALVSNGVDDISLVFDWTSGTDVVSVAFFVMNGFVLDRNITPEASSPSPGIGATDVPWDSDLAWTAGDYAASHDVYFGTDPEAVGSADRDNPLDVLVSQGQAGTSYDLERLELGQTYYWRVDEVNGTPDATIHEGAVWSFTVEPVAYPIEGIVASSNGIVSGDYGPENIVNGSGLNEEGQHSTDSEDMWFVEPVPDESVYVQFEFEKVYKLHEMWVWNYNVIFEQALGYGIKEATVEYSVDGADWMVLGDVVLEQGTCRSDYTANSMVDLQGVAAKYVKLTVNSVYGSGLRIGLSEVQFQSVPVQAREPEPADGAADVAVMGAALGWRTGREAISHNVHLSTDEQAVIDGTALVETATESSVDVDGLLGLGQTYYWKVDEVNETTGTWEGDLWSFATQASLLVEDFESYDDENNLIYEAWVDGWVNGTGATVGYFDAPFAEQTIVHSGIQSMPLTYENSGASVSEATYTFATAQDWSQYGIMGLTLWFYGDAENTAAQLYVKINDSQVVYDGATENLNRMQWQLWYVDLAGVAASDLSQVTELTIGLEGGQGILFFDDIALTPEERQLVTPAEPDTANLIAHYAFEGNADDSMGAYSGTLMGEPQFVEGYEGQAVKLDGIADFVHVESSFDLATYSVSLWFRVDGGSAERDVFSVYDSNGDHGILLEIRTNGEMRFLHRAPLGTGGGTDIYSGGVYDDGEWYHVVGAKSADTATLYLNGYPVGSAADETEFGQALQNLTLGVLKHDNLDRFLPGAIDEVYLYDRALSASEAAWLGGRTMPFDVE